MKLAVAVKEDKDWESEVNTRFGRSEYFAFIENMGEEQQLEIVTNSAASAPSGAGVEAAQLVADRGAEALIVGKVGPKAFQGLEAVGVDVYTRGGCSLEQAVEEFKRGELEEVSAPTGKAHGGLR